MVLSPLLVSCVPSVTEEEGALPEEETTPTLQVTGETIVISSTADSGPGTLRQALLDAESGDIITFDAAVFPPSASATIYLGNELPSVSQGNLTIDGSNAGVILDGSNIGEDFVPGLQIISDGNAVRGLQFVNFAPGAGISLSGGAQHNLIGGDRRIGSGPVGQGNLVSRGDIGICLGGDGTSFNTITGNLIGTDASGADDWGNSGSGMWIEDGANHNTIGPDNIIAYNQYGITVRDSNSLGNTITQNSIHDNEGEGIYLWEGGNTELPAPLIFDFNLNAGNVTGIACPNCAIQAYSDSSNEGQVYEGQTTTDGTGGFIFNKGASFTGPHLTATVTDADGNTSQFSVPTSGTSKSLVLQQGNSLSKARFQPKQSKELEDNRIGCMLSPEEEEGPLRWAEDFVYRINRMGLKRVRLSIDYFDFELVNWDGGTHSTYSIKPNHDGTIDGLADKGIKIRYCLVFWDPESPGQEKPEEEGEAEYSRFETEEEIQRYLNYTKFIVNHFKGKIEYYEILNEQQCGSGTQQFVDVDNYINLVRRVVPVIREEDPEAKVVVGAIANLYEPGDYEYLLTILRSDIMPLVDGISFHGMHGVSPDYEHREDYYAYPSVLKEIRDIASAHGFDGEYMGDELVWRTSENPLESEPWIYTEIAAAKYYARGIVTQLGLGIVTGSTQLEFDRLHSIKRVMGKVIHNLATIMSGARPTSLPIEIESEATNIRSYSFSLTNGDRLLALWTDGVAVDNDPGVEATLTLPGFSEQRVVGIDVLNGFEQELVTSPEDGNLVIQNLLVKDYPIILRLTP